MRCCSKGAFLLAMEGIVGAMLIGWELVRGLDEPIHSAYGKERSGLPLMIGHPPAWNKCSQQHGN